MGLITTMLCFVGFLLLATLPSTFGWYGKSIVFSSVFNYFNRNRLSVRKVNLFFGLHQNKEQRARLSAESGHFLDQHYC